VVSEQEPQSISKQTTRFHRRTTLLTEMVMTPMKSQWDIGSFVGSITRKRFQFP